MSVERRVVIRQSYPENGEGYISVLIEPVPYTVATDGNLLLVLHPDDFKALKEAVEQQEAVESGDFEVGKEE